ncbi:MAG: glycosyltransferase family 4 protein [Chitinophagaceae bacterium]|nr:glycosyltransferase family 4 protein [Chitinophagaceae bacterium]
MVIAVNAIFFQDEKREGYGHYAWEIVSQLIDTHPEHEFVLLFDKPYSNYFIKAPNVKAMLIKPAARHVPGFLYWYNITAAKAVKKIGAAVWLQPYGFCSLVSSTPQVLVVHDLAYKHFPKDNTKMNQWYYEKFTPQFLKKATRVITVSHFSQQDILTQFPALQKPIQVIPGAARKGFAPLNWDEKEFVKKKYTNEQEYFLFTGGISPRKNLVNLLKAFSLFKKWQKSNMKLVIAGRLAWHYEIFLEKLKTYKYRNDVVLTGYLPETDLQKLVAGAYAMIYTSNWEGFGLPIVEAMQSGVPVITSNTSSMPEVGGSAACYANPADPEDMAAQMQLLYKSETLRSSLIQAGFEQAAKYSWDHAAALCYAEIMAAIHI